MGYITLSELIQYTLMLTAVIAQSKFAEPYFSKMPGYAEQKGEFYWEHICKVSHEVKALAGDEWDKIIGVNITTIRDTDICVGKDGVPVRPAILWLDKREVEINEPFPLFNKACFSAVGMLSTAKFIRKISHCNWIAKNEPDIWKKTHKFMMLSGYMNYCFTGEFVDCTANIVGHVPYDNKKGEWLTPKKLNYWIFPIEANKLCSLKEPGDVLGNITAKAARETGIREGLPLIATGSDKGCETLGLSCTTPDKAAISFGTTATVNILLTDM